MAKIHIELQDEEIKLVDQFANERFLSRTAAATYMLRMNLIYQTFRDIEKEHNKQFKREIENNTICQETGCKERAEYSTYKDGEYKYFCENHYDRFINKKNKK